MAELREVKDVSAGEVERQIIRLAFDGDALRYREFCAKLKAGLPEGTGVALRGSVVTNKRWEDGKPFDSEGRGSSDHAEYRGISRRADRNRPVCRSTIR